MAADPRVAAFDMNVRLEDDDTGFDLNVGLEENDNGNVFPCLSFFLFPSSSIFP